MKGIIYTVIAALAALSVPAAAQDEPQSLPLGGAATWLGNTGLLVEYGQGKVLIDGFYGDRAPPLEIGTALMDGTEPFDGISDLFFTSVAPAQFDADAVTAWLEAHGGTYALVPADISVLWASGEGDEQPFLKQVVPLAGRTGEASELNYGPWFTWRFFQLKDAPETALGYWFAIPPFPQSVDTSKQQGVTPQDLTILHLGGVTDIGVLEPFRDAFAEYPVDAAFVSSSLLVEPGLADLLNAKELIGFGTAPGLDPDSMNWLETPGESRIIYKNMEE